jgi:hypothetical protein
MDKRAVLLVALLTACAGGGDDGGGDDGGDGGSRCDALVDAWEAAMDATQLTQDQAEEPTGPGGSQITDAEVREIRDAIDLQAEARDEAVAESCL